METLDRDLYDFPVYYDCLFGSDWKAEFDFLLGAYERHVGGSPRRIFEPACGTGRLLYRLAKAGYQVCGNDLNEKAVDYCNRRFLKHGLEPAAEVGDMCDFRLPRKVDLAFNMINSFRHLPSEQAAEAHLNCVAQALRSRGLYLLGLHLTPSVGQADDEESWSSRRGHLAVNSRMWSMGVDRRKRQERVGMTMDVFTPTRTFRLAQEMNFRTYTWPQMRRLLERVGKFQIAATYDFCYDLDEPIEVGAATQDVVFVLQRL